MSRKSKAVDFDTYCKSCRYWEYVEEEEPCDTCLKHLRGPSAIPLKWERKEGTKI